MTTAIVLKPDFGGTFSFGALRVAGTFVGLLGPVNTNGPSD
jgi:uncharacterized membrane protein YccC